MNDQIKHIKIFDTTLRDGEQSPGCTMNLKEKIEMAKQLEKMGVDIIEAGFAISSQGDFVSVKTIAETVKNCTVASLSRSSEKDIDRAWQAVENATNPRLHIFLATSPVHMEYKLKMSPDEVYERAVAAVKHGAKYCSNIEFSAEDATRSDLDFLARIIDGVVAAGATTINLPDTVGYTTPDEHYQFFMKLREKSDGLNKVVISAHCHDDLGMGVANSLAAIKAGATQVECTINGIGERAGNAAMEEIVMALHTRKDVLKSDTNIITTEISRSSGLLQRITGVKVQPNKAIVGENAFAHESGIHQHGVMENANTYEIMTPKSVGIKENNLVLGKHSGKHAFADRVKSLGYELSDEELLVAFDKFKALADKKKQVYDKDIEAIAAKEAVQVPRTFTLDNFVINSGNAITSTAVIRMVKDGKIIEKVSLGDGPVDAAYKAIDKIVGKKLNVEDYQLSSITEGEDALGDALVIIKGDEDVAYSGRGLSTDVIEASIQAYINAVNKLYYAEGDLFN
jgi:2-isopropylmalate synthase